MKTLRLFALAGCWITSCFGGYVYDYPSLLNPYSASQWTVNGTISASNNFVTSANHGSLIFIPSVPGVSNSYEVSMTLALTASGGDYIAYLRATSNTLVKSGPSTGTAYYVRLESPTLSSTGCNATLDVGKVISGSITHLQQTTVPCGNGMVVRSVITQANYILVYVNNVLYATVYDTSISSGQPGVQVDTAPSSDGLTAIAIGHLDTVAPNSVTSLTNSPFRDRVDLQWPADTDDPNGTGIAFYQIVRDGTEIGETMGTTFSDYTAGANNTFTYAINAVDFHANVAAGTNTNVTTPATAIDPRQVGVRPSGSYWGGAGEQIDTRSGNLNYAIPLVKAIGRGGQKVNFDLSYNSQNWRQDSAGTWQLGADAGYGFGWRVQAGSLTPLYSSAWTIAGYLFTDATGAEYRLNVNSSGVWTSEEGVYVSYNASSGLLYFVDGSFWQFGSVSAMTEPDAGTTYPTHMEDSNGNEILITYGQGLGSASTTNTSSRISTIEELRGAGNPDFTFSYTYLKPGDLYPHLTGITNSISSSENYSFAYNSSNLISPFDGVTSFGTFDFLQNTTQTGIPLTTSFTYDSGGSGELDQVTTPYGGHLRWAYTHYTLANTITYREVQYRYLAQSSGATETSVQLIRGSDSSYNVHSSATLDDSTANAEKYWTFQTDTSQFNGGLQLTYEERSLPNHTALSHYDFTWAQTPTSLNPYIGTTLTTLDPGQSYQAQKQTTQTLDQYGNVTQMQVYNFGNLSTPARTYTNTYLTGSNYIPRYIFNRLQTSTVTDGTNTATIASNSFDGTTITSDTRLHEHDDTNYPATFTYRGNVTGTTTPTSSVTNFYDMAGNQVSTTNNNVSTASTFGTSTNYGAPSQITTNSLSSTMNWSSFLGISSSTGPNGDSASINYDSNTRPQTSTSPYGASTSYTYNDGASPPNKIATTNGHWVKTSMDGFGRTIETDTGYSATTVSSTQSVYAPCGCSPLGKLSQTSEPYAPGGTVYWKTYTYDASGRTTKVALPDGSATTYLYQGNTVKVTDPAGNWKLYTMDAMGNLSTVQEPDPALGNVTTSYTYDILNHLTGVSMPRGSNTQTRSFNYTTGTTVGGFLLTATNPETGTVTYTYDSSNRLASKTDAKGQNFTYQYDSYNRITSVTWANAPGGAQVLRTYMYDTNTLDSTFSGGYTAGRLVAVQNQQFTPGKSTWPSAVALTEMYAYTQPGQVSGKRLQVIETLAGAHPIWNLDALYTYDNEGSMTSLSYPAVTAGAGPVYTYSFDSMHRPTGLKDQNNNTDVSGVSYDSANHLLGITYFGASETRQYNTLMQLTQLTVTGSASLNYTYNYPTGTNNGKISSMAVSGETITYQYDSLNRLIAAQSSASWGENYGYDSFGNLVSKTPTAGSPPTLSQAVNTANNQIVGQTYDANGNQTSAPAGGALTYDSENHLITAPGVQYGYDSHNQRAWAGTLDANGNLTGQTAYAYGADGHMLGAYTLQTGGAQYLKAYTLGLTNYFASKRVGTTNPSGVSAALGSDQLDSVGQYYPYGEGKGGNNPADTWSFASYWRDSATGLDYANNRYFSNQVGRFTGADPSWVSGHQRSPQTLNRYTYTTSDPANNYDPTGLDGTVAQPMRPVGNDNCGAGWITDPSLSGPCATGCTDVTELSCENTPPCIPGSAFAETACDGGAPPVVPCDIAEFERPTPIPGFGPAVHTYTLILNPNMGLYDILEGGPTQKPALLNPWGNWGNLNGLIWGTSASANESTPLGNESPQTSTLVASAVGTGLCEQTVTLLTHVITYDQGPQSPYQPIPKEGSGYANSNSFTFTLLSDIGDTGQTWTPNLWAPGWGITVPRL